MLTVGNRRNVEYETIDGGSGANPRIW